jgi:hypothetical protein
VQLSQKLNFYFSLAHLVSLLLREVIKRYFAVNVGVDSVSIFYGKPLKAASAFAKSYRGREIAGLLTDNFIKNQETPPARNAW